MGASPSSESGEEIKEDMRGSRTEHKIILLGTCACEPPQPRRWFLTWGVRVSRERKVHDP